MLEEVLSLDVPTSHQFDEDVTPSLDEEHEKEIDTT